MTSESHVCRNVEVAEFAAQTAGVAIDPLERCEEPVRFRTRLHRELADGSVVITGRFELCHLHDCDARTDANYGGSWDISRLVTKT